MTIYGRFNKDRGALEIMSAGAHSRGEWLAISYHKNATEAKREFYRHKNGEYVPTWTSIVKWTGEY
jgi:hypothetical protein